MLEKDASGMYFSGHLLDGYDKCIEDLKTVDIGEFSDESGVELTDRARVRIAGVITSVTVKTTKNDQRMAFFTLEDRTGEIECLMFAKTYENLGHLVRLDNALYVDGNLSVREDEVKVLVGTAAELVDDEHYTPKPAISTVGTISDRPPVPTRTVGSIHESTAPIRTVGTGVPDGPRQSTPAPKIKKLYLRVPDTEGIPYRKAINLAGIFDEGLLVPLVFYNSSTKSYEPYPKGIALSPFVMQQLIDLLGKENVIYQ